MPVWAVDADYEEKTGCTFDLGLTHKWSAFEHILLSVFHLRLHPSAMAMVAVVVVVVSFARPLVGLLSQSSLDCASASNDATLAAKRTSLHCSWPAGTGAAHAAAKHELEHTASIGGPSAL